MKLKYSPKSTNVTDMRGWQPTEQMVVDMQKRNKKDMTQRATSAWKGDKLGMKDHVNKIKKYNKEGK